MVYEIFVNGKPHRLELKRFDRQWRCTLDGQSLALDAVLARPDVLSVLIDSRAFEVKRERTATDMHLWVDSARYEVELRDPRSLRERRGAGLAEQGARKLLAPMPGKVVRVLAPEKTEVEAGQGVIIVEAMKMQNEIKSPKKGTVQRVLATEGSAVNAGDVLAIVE